MIGRAWNRVDVKVEIMTVEAAKGAVVRGPRISVQLTPLDCNTPNIGMQALAVLVVVIGQYQIRAPFQWGIFLSG